MLVIFCCTILFGNVFKNAGKCVFNNPGFIENLKNFTLCGMHYYCMRLMMHLYSYQCIELQL